jgi:PAS domain S-box-containing protein
METETHEVLTERIRQLEARLLEVEAQQLEAEEILSALRCGLVDAVIASGPDGDRVYTLKGADETYRVFLEEMAEGALTLMPDGTIVFSNPKFPAMVGLPMQQVVGSRIQEFVSEEEAAALSVLLDRARIENQKQEFCLIAHARSTVPAYIAVSYFEHGDLKCLCAVVTDLTDEKRTQRALKAAEAIQESETMLRAANEDLKQFTFAAAHDLREPLRNIRTYTELLVQSIGTGPNEDIDWMQAVIVDGVQRMEELLRDLLEYSELTAHPDNPDSVTDASVALNNALANLEAVIQETSAEVTWEPLPWICGREQNYVQLFQNLIGNAIKYRGPQPPQIAISARRQANEWVFSVRDNGIGIDPQYSVQIFGLFKRLHGKEIPGTGIGLAICQKIVERNGGRIWVESEPGKGSRFLFTLRTVDAGKTTDTRQGAKLTA